MKHFAIIGAGLTGTLMAIFLAKRGHQVSLFEKRDDMRNHKQVSGRSINLALSARGIDALKSVDLLADVIEQAVPVYGRLIHDLQGHTTHQAYGRSNDEHNWAISRANLNIVLLNATKQFDNISLFFEHGLENYDHNKQQLTFSQADNTHKTITADFVIGADGAFSKLRERMQESSDCSYQLFFEDYGYKELVISAENAAMLTDNDLHIWPRDKFMLMSLANPDGSHTLTLYLPHKGETSFESLQSDYDIEQFFKTYFNDVLPLLPDLKQQFKANPACDLLYAKVDNYFLESKALLIGDAAHAMVPFLGQGMNCGFEDVRLFCEHLDQVGIDAPNLLSSYYQNRKQDTDAIIQMALDNYLEMREAVGKASFLFQKKIEQAIMQKYPEQYISKYVLISYTDAPYHHAFKQGIKQQALLSEVAKDIDNVDNISWQKVEALLPMLLS